MIATSYSEQLFRNTRRSGHSMKRYAIDSDVKPVFRIVVVDTESGAAYYHLPTRLTNI